MSFNENTRVKIPAILHLCRLGFNYLSIFTAKHDETTDIFTDLFSESIKRINPDLEDDECANSTKFTVIERFGRSFLPNRGLSLKTQRQFARSLLANLPGLPLAGHITLC